jgi:hypothetical protein
MLTAKRTRASMALALVAVLGACGDDDKGGNDPAPDSGVVAPYDAGTTPVLDAQVDGQVLIDAQPSGDAQAADAALPLQYCLPRPGALVRAPSVGLPCELIPPGVRL